MRVMCSNVDASNSMCKYGWRSVEGLPSLVRSQETVRLRLKPQAATALRSRGAVAVVRDKRDVGAGGMYMIV